MWFFMKCKKCGFEVRLICPDCETPYEDEEGSKDFSIVKYYFLFDVVWLASDEERKYKPFMYDSDVEQVPEELLDEDNEDYQIPEDILAAAPKSSQPFVQVEAKKETDYAGTALGGLSWLGNKK